MRRIRDLDFGTIIDTIRCATDVTARRACHSTIDDDLAFAKTRADTVDTLRNHVALAVLDHAKRIEDIRFEDPLVQALVRCQNHPDARALPTIQVEGGLAGPDAAPWLREIVDAHPELAWAPDAVEELLVRGIQQAGDVEIDDSLPPWLISWEPMGAAAYALLTLVTLRTFGDL